MNNQISNPKMEVPKGIEMNDKDYINSLLSCLKEMQKNYTVALTEVSNEYLYQKYYNMFTNITSLQRKTYELMFRLGLYTLEKAEQNKITNKYNTLNQEFIDLQN